jgi:hypothetical protein
MAFFNVQVSLAWRRVVFWRERRNDFSERGSPRSESQKGNSLLLGKIGPLIGAAAP